jgi:hypothetical protein
MPLDEMLKLLLTEALRLVSGALLLLITWKFGQRILVQWEGRKKRQEVDIATSKDLQNLYAEAKQISRTWRSLVKLNCNTAANITAEKHWELQTRAIEVESKYEAIVVKLATERKLSDGDIRFLGLLRQAFQQIRDDIMDRKEHLFIGKDSGYPLFNALASDVGRIVSTGAHDEHLTSIQARTNLREISRYGSKDLFEEAAKPEYIGADRPIAELQAAERRKHLQEASSREGKQS